MKLTVRPCQESDVAHLSAQEPPGADIARRMYARQSRGESVYLLAFLDGEAVGNCEVIFGVIPQLQNLHVVEAARGKGMGTALLFAAEEHCAGYGELKLAVGVENLAAARLYERVGYRRTGQLRTTTYRYVDATGEHEATETDEWLVKKLN